MKSVPSLVTLNDMNELLLILAYTAVALILAICIGAAIIGGSDDKFR